MKNLLYSFIIALFVTLVIQGYSEKISDELSQNVVRLHIIANSDSSIDQEIKLKVRDEILKNVSLTDDEFVKKSEAISNKVLKDFSYNAHAEYGRFFFPRKEYQGITLPCGNYWGVRVVLGEGRGKNWWCVLYPPMCVSSETVSMDSYSKDKLKTAISDDAYEIISENKGKIVVKLKIVDVVNKMINLIDNL